jgi:hypothetical protein
MDAQVDWWRRFFSGPMVESWLMILSKPFNFMKMMVGFSQTA